MITEPIIHPLFPTPVYERLLDLDESELQMFKQTKMIDRSLGYVSENVQILDSAPVTAAQIMDNVCFMVNQLGYDQEMRITSSWINLHKIGNMTPDHTHANSILSGVLFLDVPPDSGHFRIASPYNSGNRLLTAQIELEQKSVTPFNTRFLHVEPTSGQLLIFPSQLHHMATESQSTEDRWTLSFNVFPTGLLRQSTTAQLQL